MALVFTPDVPLTLVEPHRVVYHPAHGANVGYPKDGGQWGSLWGGLDSDSSFGLDQAPTLGGNRYRGRVNIPKALILHTPEEVPDGHELTPVWFANPSSRNSTHYYGDNDGDLYQMVPDEIPAWAQGTHIGNRAPGSRPVWYDGYSNNTSALSIELEGYAHELADRWRRLADRKQPNPQRRSLVLWLANKSEQYGIPLDREHVMGHEELSTDRTDPGIHKLGFPIDEVLAEARFLLLKDVSVQMLANARDAGWRDGWAAGATFVAKRIRAVAEEKWTPPDRPHS